MRRSWTRAKILVLARRWNERTGFPPIASEWIFSCEDHPANNTVRGHFGSWNAMIVAAGLTPRPAHNPGRADWSRERVVAACRLFAERNERTPRTRDWLKPHPEYPHTHLAIARFGSWNAMLAAAGFLPRGTHPPRKWTEDAIANAFLDFLLREGRWPTVRDCDPSRDRRIPNRGTVYGVFGTWSAAKRYAGWDPDAKLRPVPRERVCAGCNGDYDSYTTGCGVCWGRRAKRTKYHADPVYREREKRARVERRRLSKSGAGVDGIGLIERSGTVLPAASGPATSIERAA